MAMVAKQWTLTALSTEIGIDRRTLGKRLEGLRPDGREGKSDTWLLKNVVRRLIDRSEGEELDPTQERARKDKEAADRLEMENAARRGELIERDVVDAAMIAGNTRVRTKLLAIPTKAAAVIVRDLSIPEIEALLRSHITETLQELADTDVSKLEPDNIEMVEGVYTSA